MPMPAARSTSTVARRRSSASTPATTKLAAAASPVSLINNPDGTTDVSYTAKGGYNGRCAADAPRAVFAPVPRETYVPAPREAYVPAPRFVPIPVPVFVGHRNQPPEPNHVYEPQQAQSAGDDVCPGRCQPGGSLQISGLQLIGSPAGCPRQLRGGRYQPVPASQVFASANRSATTGFFEVEGAESTTSNSGASISGLAVTPGPRLLASDCGTNATPSPS